jgi:dUTP pyrophosphatase
MSTPDTDQIPSGLDAAAAITEIHDYGQLLGYERIRVDRGQQPNKGPWYEVGYGCGELVVRTSAGTRVKTSVPVTELEIDNLKYLLKLTKTGSVRPASHRPGRVVRYPGISPPQGRAETTTPVPAPPTSNQQPLPFKLDRPELLPTRAYHDDAGFDLIVAVQTTIFAGQFADIPCGAAVQLPSGVWGLIIGRSSTLRKHRLMVNPGVIDTGWRGQLFAGVWNMGTETFVAPVGMRLAQLIPLGNLAAGLVPTEVDELTESERGTNGFGSSGI